MPSSAAEAPVKSHTANRFSQDLNGFQQTNAQKDAVTSPVGVPATPPKLQSSYSANDVPTMKSNGLSSGNTMAPAPSHQQHLHNHNVSLGRIPVGAVNNRQAREVAGDSTPVSRETQSNGYSSTPSALTASVPPFAPSNVQTSMPQMPQGASATFNPYAAMSPQQQYPYGYNMNMMNMTMNNMNIGTGQQQGPYDAYGGYGMMPYQTAPNHTTLRDSQARVIAQRRQNDGEGMNYGNRRFIHSLTLFLQL